MKGFSGFHGRRFKCTTSADTAIKPVLAHSLSCTRTGAICYEHVRGSRVAVMAHKKFTKHVRGPDTGRQNEEHPERMRREVRQSTRRELEKSKPKATGNERGAAAQRVTI